MKYGPWAGKHCDCLLHRRLLALARRRESALVSVTLQSAKQPWQRRLDYVPVLVADPHTWEISTDNSRLRTFIEQVIQEGSQ